jgi:iron complex outermembrane receptor protein
MIKEKMLSQSVRLMFSGTVLVGLTAVTQPVFAQEKIESVVVTGTRITSPGTTSNSPISSITAEEIKSSQPVAVEEFFKFLPAATPAIGPGTNNGSGGGATIDLRGLGSNRTLVLVNGRRLVPFNLAGSVDTNSIPVALINRVDLVTGGASVVYGADAVSGVANFNLKKNFTGVDLTTSYGTTTKQHDTTRRKTDLTVGANLEGGRGNVVLSIGKTSANPLTQGERDYGFTSLNSVNGTPSGSGTTVPGAFEAARDAAAGGTATLDGTWQINPATGALVQPAVAYNFNPPNYYVTGLESSQATALGNFKINDYVNVYSEVFFTHSEVASTLAPSGTFGNTFQVPIGNPLIPAAMRQQLCERRGIPAAACVPGNATMVPLLINRRFTELGPRFNNFDNKTLQFTVGAKGDIAFDWTYDAYWSRGTADQVQTRQNWGSLSKLRNSLNSTVSGNCVVATGGCVPLNVFGAEGSITPAMLAYINQNALLMQSVEQDVGAVSFSGDLGNTLVSPFARLPISMAFTAEQRKLKASTTSDSASQIQGEVLGTGAPTPDRVGSFSLKEYAVEALVPLVKDKPFMRAINLELGYRETEFTTAGKSQSYGSWKTGGEWAPIQQLRVRAMVQKATRAPNINELFAPVTTGLSNLATDPCQLALINAAEANTAGTLSNLCRLTGVPVGSIGTLSAPSAGQINRETGGNPALGPEEAKTKTLGFVWEPVKKLALTVDYYQINIEKAISSPTTTDVLDGCYSLALNPSRSMNTLCGLLGRNTINGTFNGVESRGVQTGQSNLGTQSTSGYDVNVAYKLAATQMGLSPAFGNFDIALGLNEVKSYKFQPTPASINRDCLGYYSVACGAPNYKRKFNQRTTWTFDKFSVGYNWRYLSAVKEEPGAPNFLPAFSSIGATSYVDLSGVYNITKNFRLNVSVSNIANKKPPIVGGTIGSTGTNSGNTFPQNYDAVGRYITFGASAKF